MADTSSSSADDSIDCPLFIASTVVPSLVPPSQTFSRLLARLIGCGMYGQALSCVEEDSP